MVIGGRALGNRHFVDPDTSSSCEGWVAPSELELQCRSGSLHPTDDNQLALAKIIENDIIPRLLNSQRNERVAPSSGEDALKSLALRVDEFSELVVSSDANICVDYFEMLRQQGISTEVLFQHLIAPTARRLGELWSEDINDFSDVTRGVGRLQTIIRKYGSRIAGASPHPVFGKQALLMPVRGEQHTLGLSLVREHFWREGWDVSCRAPAIIDEILELVKGQWFDLVGLSASSVPLPEELAREIRLIRNASKNRKVVVLIGGQIFLNQPELVAAVGADGTAVDGRQAVLRLSEGEWLR